MASPFTSLIIQNLGGDGQLLYSFSTRKKGLRTDVLNSPIYGNSSFEIPSFMGNSEVFNPISTNFSGCWNEGTLSSHGLPYTYQSTNSNYPLSKGFDDLNYTYTTWGNKSTGVEQATVDDYYRKVLADIPLQPMVSLGQFMHLQVNYSVNYNDYLQMGFGSMFVGGSYSNPGVPLDKTLLDVNGGSRMLGYNMYSLDNSYLANQALFDSYFFSTVPPSTVPPKPPSTSCAQWDEINTKNMGAQLEDTSTPFLNSRMVPYRKNGVAPLMDDLRDMDKAAANLLLCGAFNVNSTSVDAWRTLLSSLSGNQLSLYDVSTKRNYPFSLAELKNPIPRFWTATGNSTIDSPWCGVRGLTDVQISDLANKIVVEVKTRGPFLSMADFLNRRLGSTSSDLTRAGALQAAIDKTSPDINAKFKDAVPLPAVPYPTVSVPAAIKTNNLPSVKPIVGNMMDASSPTGQPWRTTVGMPGYLMQQDLVQAFSPVMAARSDTFVIRTYGEKTDPLTDKSVATAYCEAVVQRVPDFVDQTDGALTTPQSGFANAAGDATPVYQSDGVTRIVNPINEKFGRRFKIVSFRWLTSNDL